ncbi:MAG: hypothetical protein LCH84_16940 [Gemmatimonadetes bacterium]|nr:hypothetical protein [Gemmatimonadota bacterium]
MWPFYAFLAVHVTCGAIGLLLFWIPVIRRKGGRTHRTWGLWYARLMFVTACMALCMAITTLLDPLATHPRQVALGWSAERIRGVFGVLMAYLAVLTAHLVWHGLASVRNRAQHERNRHWGNIALNIAVLVSAAACAVVGVRLGDTLLMVFPLVGLVSALRNLWFISRRTPSKIRWQLEHVKAIVGSGISVYTAFLAFGLVRLSPDRALDPRWWAVPFVVGLSLIIYHQVRIVMAVRRSRSLAAARP